MARRSVVSQLQEAGEEALARLTSRSGATRSAVQGAMQLKERGERVMRGLESIDARLAAIERRLDALENVKPKRAASRTSSSTSSTGKAKAES